MCPNIEGFGYLGKLVNQDSFFQFKGPQTRSISCINELLRVIENETLLHIEFMNISIRTLTVSVLYSLNGDATLGADTTEQAEI